MKHKHIDILKEKILRILIMILTIVFLIPHLALALKIFPGAMGFGTDTRGAYGAANEPILCIVNTLSNASGLSNATRNGIAVKTGSLKACLAFDPKLSTSGDRGKIVLFEVSGTIEINSYLTIKHPYTSLIGQTAPSPGITLKGCTLTITTHDVLVQHIRIRTGDQLGVEPPDNRDGLQIQSNANSGPIYNVVVDHVSVSWGIDENVQIWVGSGGEIHDITISNCIVSEPLVDSIHSKGPHGMGLLVGPESSDVSIIRNFLGQTRDRAPSIKGENWTQIINNLIYNPLNLPIKFAGTKKIYSSVVGNHVIKGQNSASGINYAVVVKLGIQSGSQLYVRDNRCRNYNSNNDWASVNNLSGFNIQVSSPPVPISGVDILSSADVEGHIIKNAGAWPANRDYIDEKVINDFLIGKGTYVNCVEYDRDNTKCNEAHENAGGWPILEENLQALVFPTDPHSDVDENGYKSLEEWIHEITAKVEAALSVPKDLSIKK